MNKKKPEKDFINSIWNFFISMKVAVFFILLLAVVSIIGTVIPQQKPVPDFYEMVYSPFWAKLIILSGFYDLYNSTIYKLVLTIVGINLVVCSIEHFNNKLGIIKGPAVSLPFDAYKSKKFIKFTLPFSLEKAFEKVSKVLKRKWFQIKYEEDDEGIKYIYGEKGKIKPWGPFIVHIGILVIFLGALYGGVSGFKDRAFLIETFDDTYIEKSRNFKVKLKETSVTGDEKHRVKDYYSELEVYEGDEKILEKIIEVNHPLIYKGIVFYQSSWGMVGLDLKVSSPEGREEFHQIQLSETGDIIPGNNFFVLPDKSIVKVDAFYPDALEKNGKVINISNLPLNPAIYLQVSKDFVTKHMKGEEPSWDVIGWHFMHDKEIEFGGYKIAFDRVIEYSGLQIKKDPGIPVVYFGCFLLMIGMPIAFYIDRKIIRLCLLRKTETETCIHIGFSGKAGDGERKFLESVKNDLEKL